MAQYSSTTICLYDLKNALLYFENVIPFSILLESVNEQLLTGKTRPFGYDIPMAKILQGTLTEEERVAAILSRALLTLDILPERLRTDKEFLPEYSQLMFAKLIADAAASQFESERRERALFAFLSTEMLPFLKFAEKFGLLQTPIDFPEQFTSTDETPGDWALTLHSLNLIDTSQVSLEHIVEFRKDKESLKKMRDFRLFFYERCDGKSRDEIKDVIGQKFDAYEKARTSWGFLPAVGSTLTLLKDAKTLETTTFLGALIAMVVGDQHAAAALSAAGGMITVAGVTVELRKKHVEFRDKLRDNPISYISDAREHLEERPPERTK
jgi:hypothetical protein